MNLRIIPLFPSFGFGFFMGNSECGCWTLKLILVLWAIEIGFANPYCKNLEESESFARTIVEGTE